MLLLPIVYLVAVIQPTTPSIHFWCQTQVALLTIKDTKILVKYSNFSDNLCPDSLAKLPEYIGIINDFLNLANYKNPTYGLIYSLKPIEYKILKTYIKTKLTFGLIGSFKSSASSLIVFVCQKNSYVWLFLDYWKFNHLTMGNRYLLPFIH